ncbi:MAG: DUF1015 domain-containing protein [Acidobacteria bacterium]|nr:DUF1015 domain-containing protein [Acidobacteriota bacterium]
MTIHPFRAWRFNPQRVRLADVVTQPYDKIDETMREEYYRRSPYNLVRVIRARETDDGSEEGYAAAGRLWQRWIQEEVLTQEKRPAFFVYRQKFPAAGRLHVRHALVGLLDLSHSQRVLAHERTLSGPQADRLRLIRQTESNDGLIFLLYRDPSGTLGRISAAVENMPVLESVVDEYGTGHEIFALDPDRAPFPNDVFEPGDLVIADGHHRFSVALQFKRECEALGWKPAAPESFDKRMVAIVDMSDPGLQILPTHRVVFGISAGILAAWEEGMSAAFERIETQNLEETLSRLAAAGRGSFGVMASGRWAVWKLRHRPSPEEFDVSILHAEILGKTLGITENEVASETRVRYFREPEKAAEEVRCGRGQVAFFLNPTPIGQVEACARRHQVMPQKSTDFFPKMLSGLLFMKMEIQKS